MPNARRSRTIAAPAPALWEVISDPHHLPRWWPRVSRVEDVHEGAFTEVMKTRKGKTVRADFDLVHADEQSGTVRWEQRLEGTPFAAVLQSSETELRLVPVGADGVDSEGSGTEVTIEMRQELSGGRAAKPQQGARSFARLNVSWGGRLVRRAALATIDEALDGLERISV
jgi:uncharacterized protein YndB with AHSA1/START domain